MTLMNFCDKNKLEKSIFMKSSANLFFDFIGFDLLERSKPMSQRNCESKAHCITLILIVFVFFGGGQEDVFISKQLNRDYEAHSELVMAVTRQRMNDRLLKARRRSGCETELSRWRRRREVDLLDL